MNIYSYIGGIKMNELKNSDKYIKNNKESNNLKLNDEEYQNLSELFKVFSDKTRLKIINILLENEMCVHNISNNLNMNQSAISHQLKVLKQMRLVKYRREGKEIFYSLIDEHVSLLFEIGLEHIRE
jgi:DNA-binding transcriptional ArsR family regulator